MEVKLKAGTTTSENMNQSETINIIETIQNDSLKTDSKPLFPWCYKCRKVIGEQYCFSLGDGRLWHMTCLKCAVCQKNLESQKSCFAKDGEIFCHQDYLKIQQQKNPDPSIIINLPADPANSNAQNNNSISSKKKIIECDSCGLEVKRNDLIIQCPSVVETNENGRVLIDYRNRFRIFHVNCFKCVICDKKLKPGDAYCLSKTGPFCFHHVNSSTMNDMEEIIQRRKQSLSTNKDEPLLNDDENSYDNGDLYYFQGSSRQKRMRTSFKHHQLRTMKAYFAINHNPDAKDLKSLSEKTGLSKRVLQVWFQNARAKYRRSLMRSEMNGQNGSTIQNVNKGSSSLSEDHMSNTSSGNLDQNLADLSKFTRLGSMMDNFSQDFDVSDLEFDDEDNLASLNQTSTFMEKSRFSKNPPPQKYGSNDESTDEDSQDFESLYDSQVFHQAPPHGSMMSYLEQGKSTENSITSIHLYAMNQAGREELASASPLATTDSNFYENFYSKIPGQRMLKRNLTNTTLA